MRVNENGQQKTLNAEWLGNARLKPLSAGVYWIKWLEVSPPGVRGKFLLSMPGEGVR